MKNKNSGFMGSIYQIIMAIIFAGVFLALLSRFDFDIIAMFEWILMGIWTMIITIADWFASLPMFQRITA